MTIELQDKLTKTFPWVGKNFYPECLDGWQWIILDMLREIDDYYFNLNRECDVLILQVKEKWGMVRIYFTCDDEDFEDVNNIATKYEQLSKSTCELCGEEGRAINMGGWIVVRCEECEEI